MEPNKVLLVDDEPKVLSSLSRGLYELDIYEVFTASNGMDGLDVLRKNPTIAVIVSDYHMPGMNGVNFLAEAQKIAPDAARIILTGAAGLNMAIDSVNRGKLFRFLIKPCDMELFLQIIKSAVRQYQLLTAEHDLLSKTLNGSIKVMMDILSALNSQVFYRATRLRDLAHSLALEMQVEQLWEVDLAAMLCQIGCVAVPQEVLEKWVMGDALDDREMTIVQSISKTGSQLVKNIPRLENVAVAIACQDIPFGGLHQVADGISGLRIPMVSRILKIVMDFDLYLARTFDQNRAFQEMIKRLDDYDPEMFEIFRSKVLKIDNVLSHSSLQNLSGMSERKVNIEDVQIGMVLMNDIMDGRGRLVVSKGTVISEVLKTRLENYFWTRAIVDPVVVGVKR